MKSGMRVLAICGLVTLFASPCVAATVSVQIVESGPSLDTPPIEATSAWEAGIMNAFFDAGHIVSNGTSIRLGPDVKRSGLFPADASFGVEAARSGSSDYLALVVLNYADTLSVQPRITTRRTPDSVAFKLVKLDTLEVVAEGARDSLKQTASGHEDEQIAEEVARFLITRMKER